MEGAQEAPRSNGVNLAFRLCLSGFKLKGNATQPFLCHFLEPDVFPEEGTGADAGAGAGSSLGASPRAHLPKPHMQMRP